MKKKLEYMTLSERLAYRLNYFTTNPKRRSINSTGGCYYYGKNTGTKCIGGGCFVGMEMTPHQRKKADKVLNPQSSAIYQDSSITFLVEAMLDGALEPIPYIIENSSVLGAFQTLHDVSSSWTSTGLSKEGKKELATIIQNYSLNPEPFKKFLV